MPNKPAGVLGIQASRGPGRAALEIGASIGLDARGLGLGQTRGNPPARLAPSPRLLKLVQIERNPLIAPSALNLQDYGVARVKPRQRRPQRIQGVDLCLVDGVYDVSAL